jgi:energy-coupling factor transporter ATP-binding protein EcfA2
LITNGGTTEFDDLNDLSSGEKTILRTVLWFYNTKHNGIFPKLFLLDEPDAHLHPSMTRQFIDIVKGVLVDQFGVRVILTTHSPSTVALAPDDSIFVMHRELPRIRRPTSKAEAIGLLTSGLVTVSAGTKYVFVEDRDDVTFFSLIRDILADQGPSKDQMALAPAPSIVFMASSIGKKNKVQSGGKNVVAQWVAKFDTPPLKDMFSGLIDLDDGNAETPRLKVIGRYGIENYRLDPIVVFALLNEESKAPNIPGVEISTGNEHYLRDFPVNKLQLIIDVVANQIEPQLGLSDIQEKEQADVTFTNGVMLKYPKWMLTRRGHDLLRVYQNVFGSFITPPRLDKVYQRVRLVPKELAVIMTKLQKQ